MYDLDGNLKLLEINTAVGLDNIERVEQIEDCIDLTALDTFVKSKNFTNIHYIGGMIPLSNIFKTYCESNSIVYEFHKVGSEAITVPFIEDNDSTLIIRSSYDTTALVDDTYCRDKVEFMKLIQSQSFGSQFAYIDADGNLVNNITTIKDNGENPNFVLKSRYPGYDPEAYPKFYKVSNQSELDTILLNVTNEYFLMEFHYNNQNLYNDHIKVIRSLNLLFPPNLESIQIGQYTKLNQNKLYSGLTYDTVTFELNPLQRNSYVSFGYGIMLPKLLDTDTVEMADGSFKTALDLQVGDVIKTIDIPNPNGTDNASYIANFGITYDTLLSGTTYSTNVVTYKKKIDRLAIMSQIVFEDGSTWDDTEDSSYLIDRSNNIQFERIGDIKSGDTVLLINTQTQNVVDFTRKTVASVSTNKSVFSGWEITVANAHLFLTKTSSTNNESFVSIEHNTVYCPNGACPCYSACASCPKNAPMCYQGVCSNVFC
jgi:hypothetical protein